MAPVIIAETGKHDSNDRARNCLSPPGFAASKSKFKLKRNSPDHIFSHFCSHFDKGREGIDFHLGSGSHHLSPYHLSISSPSFFFTPIASASSTRISLRYPPGSLSLFPFSLTLASPVFLVISVLGNHRSPTGLIIFPVSAHLMELPLCTQ